MLVCEGGWSLWSKMATMRSTIPNTVQAVQYLPLKSIITELNLIPSTVQICKDETLASKLGTQAFARDCNPSSMDLDTLFWLDDPITAWVSGTCTSTSTTKNVLAYVTWRALPLKELLNLQAVSRATLTVCDRLTSDPAPAPAPAVDEVSISVVTYVEETRDPGAPHEYRPTLVGPIMSDGLPSTSCPRVWTVTCTPVHGGLPEMAQLVGTDASCTLWGPPFTTPV